MGNNVDSKFEEQMLQELAQNEAEFLKGPKLHNVEDITFPLSTKNIKIVDAKGMRVKLSCANWSGAHMCRHCPDGLECRKLEDICAEIRKFGFNCIRLTYSLQMYYDNPVIPDKYLKANPQLKGKKAMQIFDIVVEELTKAGIMIIMNNHISSSMWCCSTSDGEGLWWTHKYPEHMWIDCIKHFAKRYANNRRVMAVDLRNEIRSTPEYDPTWGDGNPVTDWRRAAILGANQILSVNPDLLIMIGGLNFGLDLTGIAKAPIQLKVENKLVYTGHFYGFSWPIITWRLWSYQQFKQKLFHDQVFVRALKVPFFIGEFGTNTPDIPWVYLIRYLRETDIDWSYWPLDGFKCDPEKDQTYGIYNNDWSGVRHPWLLKDLQSLKEPLKYGELPATGPMIKYTSDIQSSGKGHPEKLFTEPPRSKSPQTKMQPVPAYQLSYNSHNYPQTFTKQPQTSHTVQGQSAKTKGIGVTVTEKAQYQQKPVYGEKVQAVHSEIPQSQIPQGSPQQTHKIASSYIGTDAGVKKVNQAFNIGIANLLGLLPPNKTGGTGFNQPELSRPPN